MVPVQSLPLKHEVGYDGKYHQADTLLDYLELYQGERPTIGIEPYPVGGYLAAIFEKSYGPREHDDTNKGPVARDASLL